MIDNYKFSGSDDPEREVISLFGSLNILEKGHASNHRVGNFVRGNWDCFDLVLFDYEITVGYFRVFFINHYMVICVDVGKFDLPEFDMRPKNKVLNKYIGTQEYYLKNYPLFSKKYSLRAKYIEKVQKLLTPKMISFFEKKDHPFAMKVRGGKFLYIKNFRFDKSANHERFMNEAVEILRILIYAKNQ